MSAAMIQVILVFLGLLGLVFLGFVFFNILMVLKVIEDHIERYVNHWVGKPEDTVVLIEKEDEDT